MGVRGGSGMRFELRIIKSVQDSCPDRINRVVFDYLGQVSFQASLTFCATSELLPSLSPLSPVASESLFVEVF